MKYTGRRATKRDIPAFIRIQKHDGFPHQYYLTKGRLEKLFDRGEQFYVISIHGTPVGFGSVDCEIRAQVHLICVDAAFAGNGIGRTLMRLCLARAKQRGCKRACSYVEANSSKEPFLVKMGFHQVGLYKDRYGNGVDATIWEIALP